ncbi:MAG: AIPR family protein [Betaproteobacteria bacterium]|jgi:hypothetical protein
MDLQEFLRETLAEVAAEVADRMTDGGTTYPHEETVFADVVMNHMAEIGMTSDPEVCHFQSKLGNAQLRLTGWALSEDNDQLDLFVSLFSGAPELSSIADADTMNAAKQCVRFLESCVDGTLVKRIDPSNDAYAIAMSLQHAYPDLEQVRIYVLTDRVAKSKNFKSRELAGKLVKLEVMDIERLHRHWAEGKPRDELVVNFEDVCGSALPCVYVPGEESGYDYALTAMPGEALRHLYEKFGARLLEANVRSFLSATAKVNKGIRDTLRSTPELFMAYNNGIVVVADEAGAGVTKDGIPGLLWLRGMQIVNGGQTTASIYFTKRKNPEVDLSRVRVPAKVIVLRSRDSVVEEALIADISRYANSQNAVKLSDLSANKPFHVELERLANSTFCPDGVSRWFYERAAGSYATLLEREGTTAAKRKKLKDAIPTSRRVTKTDLAKYLNAWAQRPDLVSQGSQKNFDKFMAEMAGDDQASAPTLPDVNAYKLIIAKAILFRRTSALVRPMFPAFQANVAAYVVAVVSKLVGEQLDLMRIWLQQDLSAQLRAQLQVWAQEVNEVLHRTADGRMVSEWAKRPECWAAVQSASYSKAKAGIPELR